MRARAAALWEHLCFRWCQRAWAASSECCEFRVDEGAVAALAAPSLSPTCVCGEKQCVDSVCAESGGEREQGRCTYFCK